MLRDVGATLAGFRDARVFRALVDLASTASATAQSRSMALHGILAQHTPNVLLHGPIQFDAEYQRCPELVVTFPDPREGTPLPADYLQQAYAVANQVAEGIGNPQSLRALASCVRWQFSISMPPDVDAAKIRLIYECGNTFRVVNPNPDWADLRYDVYQTEYGADLSAPPNGETKIFPEGPGTTRLYYDGKLIQSVENQATPCP